MPRAKKVDPVEDVQETVTKARAKKASADEGTKARAKKVSADEGTKTATRTRAKKVSSDEGTTTRRRRAPKDKNAPKKPLNSYMLFRNDWIKNHPREFETMKKSPIPEQGKEFGRMWKDLKAKKPNEAAKYQKSYADSMAKFHKEMEAYNAKLTSQA